jgi:phosphoribosylanthranilate isomerase
MTRTRTKLCGMTTPEDAMAACDAGADAIGMILHAPGAKRLIGIDVARRIVDAVLPYVTPVGVFVDAGTERVIEIAREVGLSTVQFHGQESADDVRAIGPLRVVKAIKADRATVRSDLDGWRDARARGRVPNLVGILLESPVVGASGGTGVANDFDLIASLQSEGEFDGLPPLLISGGLTPDNVAGVVQLLRPYAVDVSSGIEASPGRKSVEKMRAFVANAASV